MTPTPNWFAAVALLTWPLVAAWIYRAQPVGKATIWTILGAYLLLPVGTQFKLEMIPTLDKYSISTLAAFFGCMIVTRRPARFGNGFGLAEILIFTIVICPLITSLLNGDQITIGAIVLPGIGGYEGISALIAQFISLVPFFLGRQFLRSGSDIEDIMRALGIAGLLYSLPMLFEVRMSPQLHTWIYGYFPHVMFGQQIRDGGFRPVVFLGHGLIVAMFAVTALVAATALWRTQTRIARIPPGGVTAYLSVVLVLCKTFGASLYGILCVPLVRWATPWIQLRVAAAIVTIVLAYPMLRTMNLVPTTTLVDVVRSVSTERAGSLEVRFTQEGQLLARASERFWFGWGRFGRSRVYDDAGNDISLTDGYWIITMGQFGFIGFLAQFGLLAVTVFRAASAPLFVSSSRDKAFLAAMTLIVAINIFDLLPNASIRPWTWLIAGALLGRAEVLRTAAEERAASRRPISTTNFSLSNSNKNKQTRVTFRE